MSKKINATSFDEIFRALDRLESELEKIGEEIVQEIAIAGEIRLQQEWSSREVDPNIVDYSIGIAKKRNGYAIQATGEDVVYEEFGTGDKGADDGHPWKGQTSFPLNAYNSGETISDVADIASQETRNKLAAHGIVSGKFWSYPNKQGEGRTLTQGVKSGKELYNTSKYLQDVEIKRILEQKAGEVLSKL